MEQKEKTTRDTSSDLDSGLLFTIAGVLQVFASIFGGISGWLLTATALCFIGVGIVRIITEASQKRVTSWAWLGLIAMFVLYAIANQINIANSLV